MIKFCSSILVFPDEKYATDAAPAIRRYGTALLLHKFHYRIA